MMRATASLVPSRAAWALLLPGVLAACDRPVAIGDATQVLVATDQRTWDALEPQIRAAMEPTTFTVRDERVFDIAHVETQEEGWPNLRVTRQILLIGEASEPAISDAISEVGDAPPPPSLFQARNVWAQNQLVTVLLMPEGADPSVVQPLLPQLGETYLRQFEEYARSRMYVTGVNEELADTLSRTAGFSIALPHVYRREPSGEGIYLFRNDQPDPSRLIRNISVASRPRSEAPMTPETATSWRAQLAEEYVQPPQVTEPTTDFQAMQVGNRPALQVQGIWSNPPGGWPAAGPFVTRLVDCPDRVFLVDAWLYAPGVPKYEYMYQLKTILDSFRCGGAS